MAVVVLVVATFPIYLNDKLGAVEESVELLYFAGFIIFFISALLSSKTKAGKEFIYRTQN